jgi:His-Xaa-Ser system protein HxsD
VNITLDLAIYPIELVLRACHAFTARCFISPRATANGQIVIELIARDASDPLEDLAGELANALLDSRLRAIIAEETRAIRELLVAQAFCEADLLDRRAIESDEYADPRGIAR